MREIISESQGLSDAEAVRSLRTDGPNELPAANARSSFRIIVDVLREPMFGLLVATGLIYLVLGSHAEAIAPMNPS